MPRVQWDDKFNSDRAWWLTKLLTLEAPKGVKGDSLEVNIKHWKDAAPGTYDGEQNRRPITVIYRSPKGGARAVFWLTVKDAKALVDVLVQGIGLYSRVKVPLKSIPASGEQAPVKKQRKPKAKPMNPQKAQVEVKAADQPDVASPKTLAEFMEMAKVLGYETVSQIKFVLGSEIDEVTDYSVAFAKLRKALSA